MDHAERARRFTSLHVKGDPLILYNVWDAGSAKAVADAGAKAIATGSWSVAAAQGYPDGEAIPLDLLETIATRIAATVDAPLTIDFEGGYAAAPEEAARNVARIVAAGAVGINFEDRVVGGEGLHGIAEQSRRIEAIRRLAEASGIPLFINARTDVFLQAGAADHAARLAAALERAAAYQDAGASGVFAPGLIDETLIGELCAAVAAPVNIMVRKGVPATARLAELGVARVSYGPAPYRMTMEELTARAREALGG